MYDVSKRSTNILYDREFISAFEWICVLLRAVTAFLVIVLITSLPVYKNLVKRMPVSHILFILQTSCKPTIKCVYRIPVSYHLYCRHRVNLISKEQFRNFLGLGDISSGINSSLLPRSGRGGGGGCGTYTLRTNGASLHL